MESSGHIFEHSVNCVTPARDRLQRGLPDLGLDRVWNRGQFGSHEEFFKRTFQGLSYPKTDLRSQTSSEL